jgi:hypothetical protein
VDLFNRVLVVVLALVTLVAAGVALLTTLGLFQPEQVAPMGAWFVDRLVIFTQLDPSSRGWSVGVCLALILLAVVVLVLEFRPGPRAARSIVLKEDPLGRVTVALDGISALVDREASRVAGVLRARSEVAEETAGLRIACRVSVDPESSVPDVSQQLRERLKTVVEHHVGLKVTQVAVDVAVPALPASQRHRRVE